MIHAPAAIEAQFVSKEYRSLSRRVRALDGVEIQVGRGEVYGLLGANGAGKTTLVKVLLGLTSPSSGRARLRGLDPRLPHSRRRIGYLPEGHRFPDYLSGIETLRLFGRLAGVGEAALEARIRDLLELVGIAARGTDRVGRYSKGMTQRLGLAAALIDDPEVLFLDEPTDGVDPVGRRHIRDVLLARRAAGTTIFINSHLLSEVERTCDRVAILDRGRLVREGTVEALTHAAQRFRVRLDGPAPALERLQVPGAWVRADAGGIDVEVESIESLNRVLDALRTERALIAEVAPLRSALEDVFVAALNRDAT